ncbi:MAG: site-2 protease family protein, partial [Chloroflexi bacterium]|nr:site-2 protease family protein [Chloroflexota bacterium]
MTAMGSIDERTWVRELLADVMEIEDITLGALGGRAVRVRGHFLLDTREAYDRVAPRCRAAGRTLLFRQEQGEPVALIVDAVARPKHDKLWVPIVLGVVTLLSMLFSHSFYWGSSEPSWASFWASLPQALAATASLLAILLSHELGHYFMARRLGVAVTLPYLIPFPLSPFGTMGAVIHMKEIPPSRRAMLLIGAAGPIAGLVVAIPLLALGL